jgi:alpha-glucosidase
MGFGRDPERSPMQWDDGPNAGFCPPTAEPWLPIPDDYTQVNVATQRKDQRSMLSLTRALLKLRCATQALTLGSYVPIEGVPEECFLYVRQLGRQRRLIALNFSSSGQQIQLSEMGSGRVLVSTHLDREEPVDLASFYLRADEGCVIEQQDTM